jgi:hypothetical protein
MTFKSPIWQPIAILLSAINLVAVGLAAGAAEPWHAAGHAALALVFGLGAQRLRRRPVGREVGSEIGGEHEARLEVLEAEVNNLGRELSEAQERLDFTERMLAQRPESRQVGPER